MASGDTLCSWDVHSAEQPASNFASFFVRNNHLEACFDSATDETLYFSGVLPRNYAGGGITVYLHWTATATSGANVMWTTAFEQITGLDIDGDSFATAVAWSAQASSVTSGLVVVDSQAHTDGAQIDGIVVGDSFRLAVVRDANHASDDLLADADLVFVELKET